MIDVVVAGGGPAGLAVALHAARAGLDVVVLEPRTGPIDKACGEGLMPAAVRELADLGIDPAGMPFRGIRYLTSDGSVTATANFIHGDGRGVRRTVLHQAMRDAVAAAGIPVVEAKAAAVTQTNDTATVAEYTARYVVAADGLHSPIRTNLGLTGGVRAPSLRRPAKRYGIRAHYDVASWSEHVEVSWSADSEAYVTPVGPHCVGVAVLSANRVPYEQHLNAFPALLERLGNAPHGDVRAAGPLRQPVRRRTAGRVALVGDAAGYVDALTGEGIALALACAPALVHRIATGQLAEYEADYRRISRRYRMLTGGLLAATGIPTVRRMIVPAARKLPRVFEAVVGQLAG